ncbi:NUDIX domain-containing protein [Glycomyces dulcitolivorans]|uniref:NUDIX domain-containing protein n=1 Tax=Glycomyces dulcitolivorans TaxID=2200759 RepID=UPI000DD47C2C|nr:NUDIX hydrolase [Glycomyces dulcitolivorans]
MTNHDTEERNTVLYAADVIVFHDSQVLLIKRAYAPFEGHRAIPGGHVDADETSRAAAARELTEETGLTIDPAHLRMVGVYDDPDRDPRGRVVSVAYAIELTELQAIRAGDDAADAMWVDIEQALAGPLAFDHPNILGDAYSLLMDDQL